MPLFTETVTGGTAREVYGGLTALDAYAFDMIGTAATTFRALAADDRKRLLITATRYIDRQRWQGEANEDGGTTLAFPRDDLPDEPTNAEQLALVNQAVFELVVLGATDSSIFDSADQGSNIKSMGAGKGRMEFFSPTRPGSGASKLPTAASELIGMWLAGNGEMPLVSGAPASTGTCGDSYFERCDEHKRNEPF
jgi:hypothetical protein